jgi:hypothetical protein
MVYTVQQLEVTKELNKDGAGKVSLKGWQVHDFARQHFIIVVEIQGVFTNCILGLGICHGRVTYVAIVFRYKFERLVSRSGQLQPHPTPSLKVDCSSDRNSFQHWPQNLHTLSRVLICVICYGWRIRTEVASCWTATEDQFLRHHWQRPIHRPYLLNSTSAMKHLIPRSVQRRHQGLVKQEIGFDSWHGQTLLST